MLKSVFYFLACSFTFIFKQIIKKVKKFQPNLGKPRYRCSVFNIKTVLRNTIFLLLFIRSLANQVLIKNDLYTFVLRH